jgi:hypothetical protein
MEAQDLLLPHEMRWSIRFVPGHNPRVEMVIGPAFTLDQAMTLHKVTTEFTQLAAKKFDFPVVYAEPASPRQMQT